MAKMSGLRRIGMLTLPQIVTQASAGFVGQKADMILNVDHRQICKYDSRFASGYMNILAQLKKIRQTLLSGGANKDFAEVGKKVRT